MEKINLEPISLTQDAALSKLKKGTPLLLRKGFKVDIPSASWLFNELCQILKSQNTESAQEVEKIEAALEAEELKLEDLFSSVLKGGTQISELANSLSLDEDILLMLATASAKPSLQAIADQVKDIIKETPWSEIYCPVCGSIPAISELRVVTSTGIEGGVSEGAERIVYCSFCSTEWRVNRMGCSFCDNTESEDLQYFYVEGDEGHRIDTCEKCKKYMKTMDIRNIGHQVILSLEDMATLHLDIIAEEKGYKREAWLMPYFSI